MIPVKFNNTFYTVYNVLTVEKKIDSIYPIQEIYELYSMLINSQHVVTIEDHKSQDELRYELRVIFWNKESYNLWAEENRKRYDDLIISFHKVNSTGIVKFERHTSVDNYISEFPYTIYPDKSTLLSWSLVPYHKSFIINDLCPLGKIQDYLGKGEFVPTLNGARFILERTSDIVRRPVSENATKDGNFPKVLAYSFQQSIQHLMYPAPWLYRKLIKLTNDVEQLASKYILDCDNAAVLIGHNSMGHELTMHTHRLSDETRYTFTIITRMTFEDKGAFVRFYDPIDNDDTNLPFYYSNPALLTDTFQDKKSNGFTIESRASLLVFSASYIPHLVQYDNDIYLFYVYDNVTFKPGMFESIVNNSHLNFFTNQSTDKRLYYQRIE